MADDVEKRLRYFTGQFLVERDFTDEQKYFLDRLDRHHRFLHTPGVADGLLVKGEVNSTQVTVEKGTAIDGNGKQIVLSSASPVFLNTPELLKKLTDDSNTLFIVISYDEQETDPAGGSKEATRWHEKPIVVAILANENKPEVQFIRLASLKVSKEGKLTELPQDIRKKAGQQSISDDSITEAKLDKATRNKLVNNGNNHDHRGGNGAQLKHSSLNKDDGPNPHNTTAEDIDALSRTKGGKVSGRVFIQKSVPGIYEPEGDKDKKIGDKGSFFVLNTSNKSYGLVAELAETIDVLPPTDKTIPPAAVVAIAGFPGANAIYATARQGTPALLVEGTARITGTGGDKAITALEVQGKAVITGGTSTAHIVDTFINASGQRLRTGDVVKLKGTPVTRFRGLQNKAPIAEVTLADRENDTLVIGIVDGEAIPDSGQPDTRVEPEDPTFIEDGGELYLVTLGVFAHCKVDATKAPIEVGDLLTSSTNPGHAQKATQPRIGSIIGKALQPLEKGTGEISVFVNIQ